jgi:hypothetical protein
MREFAPQAGVMATAAAPYLFVAAALIQAMAVAAFLAGHRRPAAASAVHLPD